MQCTSVCLGACVQHAVHVRVFFLGAQVQRGEGMSIGCDQLKCIASAAVYHDSSQFHNCTSYVIPLFTIAHPHGLNHKNTTHTHMYTHTYTHTHMHT